MSRKIYSNLNDGYSLGKGEVLSSILSGSTTNAHEIRASGEPPASHPAVSGRTPPEHDSSTRGKSGEFVQAAFALCRWAKGQPWAVRMNVMIAVKQLRLAARHDSPALRGNAMRALARIQT